MDNSECSHWSVIRWRETEIKSGAIDEDIIYSQLIYGDADLSKSQRLIDYMYKDD